MRNRTQRVIADVAAGAVAGGLATWMMGKVTSVLYQRENEQARRREDEARGGMTAYEAAAEKIAGLANGELSAEAREQYGKKIHWMLGIGTGALYGVLRRRLPQAGLAGGLAFGAGFFLVVDEGANYLLGLTPGPRQFPWQAHARGLAGHLVFGAVADATVRTLRPAA